MYFNYKFLLLIFSSFTLLSSCLIHASSVIGGSSERGPPPNTPSGLSDQSAYVKLESTDTEDDSFPQVGSAISVADFNGDRFVDFLTLTDDLKTLRVHLWNHQEYQFVSQAKEISPEGNRISAVATGDFNNDGITDIVVVAADKGYVYYAAKSGNFTQGPILSYLTDNFLVMDADADLVPDIFYITNTGLRAFYSNSPPGIFTSKDWSDPNLNCKVLNPSSNAFADLDGDCLPDLILTTDCGIEFWSNPLGSKPFWDLKATEYGPNFRIIDGLSWSTSSSQLTFTDLNGDGTVDIAVYKSSSLDVFLNIQKSRSYGALCTIDREWVLEKRRGVSSVSFAPTKLGGFLHSITIPITIRSGDINYDGFPDLLGIASNGSVLSFRNLGNWDNQDTSSDHFEIYNIKDNPLLEISDAIAFSFFDTDESGRRDILLALSHGSKLIWNNFNMEADSLFFKGTGLSSLSYFDSSKPFAPVAGNTFKISFDSPDGHKIFTCSQCPQSSYYVLQTCTCFFGLKRISNYIEELTLGAGKHTRSWTNLMPNSIAIVWCDSSDGTKTWWMEYFTQRRGGQMLGVVIALSVTLVVLAIIIWYLSWKERKEDKAEQNERASLFSFGAM